jgi:hypothetical protein
MSTTEDRTEIRELDRRAAGGIEVSLLWAPLTRSVVVAVSDERMREEFAFRVDAADALDAFRHPYAYADRAAPAEREAA